MAQQMINERTFSSESIRDLSRGGEVPRRMSVGGTVLKTLVLFVLTCAFAAVGWDRADTVIQATSGPSWLLGYFLLIALSFLAIAKPRLAPIGGFVYAVLMGLWVGAISKVYEAAYDGIVAQALLATMATVLVCLVLYAFGVVKVTRRFALVVVAATLGIGLMYLAAWILSIFGVSLRLWTDPSPTGYRDQRGDLHRGGAQPVHRLRGDRPRRREQSALVHGVVLSVGSAGHRGVALPRGAVPARSATALTAGGLSWRDRCRWRPPACEGWLKRGRDHPRGRRLVLRIRRASRRPNAPRPTRDRGWRGSGMSGGTVMRTRLSE